MIVRNPAQIKQDARATIAADLLRGYVSSEARLKPIGFDGLPALLANIGSLEPASVMPAD
jgi:Trk K+ transport system NAD-binding subunit